MKKSYSMTMISVVVLVILFGMSYWYMQMKKNEAVIIPETTSEVVVPSVSTNPLDNKPDINPVDQANPFKNVKTNPFE